MLPDFSALNEKYEGLCTRLDELTVALNSFPRSEQQHSPQLREWERFVLFDGGVCVGGAVTVGGNDSNLTPAPNGWEAYVTSVAITLSGASAAATCAAYNGDLSDQNLFDYSPAFLGNTPSRLVSFYEPETLFSEQAESLTFDIAAAAATATCVVRVTGKRRQV